MLNNDLIDELLRIEHEYGDNIDVVIYKDGIEQGSVNTINYNICTDKIELSTDTIRDDYS